MKNNVIDMSFGTFAAEAKHRGYDPVQYSQTGFYVKSTNGIRCEMQKTNGGINSVGYGSSAKIVEALKAHIKAHKELPLVLVKELKGSVNFAFKDLDGFFALVSMVETLKIDAPAKAGRPAGTAKVKAEKAKAPKILKVSSTDHKTSEITKTKSTEPTKQEKAVLNATGGEAKNIAEIKAGNLARLKKVNEKMLAEKAKEDASRAETDALIEDMVSDFQVPAFLENDINGGQKPAAE